MQTLVFALNSAALSEQAKSALDQIAGAVGGQQFGYMIEVQGYTDNTGDEQYNIGLSQRRAEAVERYLVSKNIPLFRVSIVGLGKDKPVADNKTRDGRAQNRRVEVRVLKATSFRQTNWRPADIPSFLGGFGGTVAAVYDRRRSSIQSWTSSAVIR